jgi:hypothetical protein
LCSYIEQINFLTNIVFPIFFIILFILVFNQNDDYKGSLKGELAGPLALLFDGKYVKKNVRWLRPIFGFFFFGIVVLILVKLIISC